jgi:hypothetical protein
VLGRDLLFLPQRPPEHPRTVVVHLVGNVGDITVALPALRALRDRYPDSRLPGARIETIPFPAHLVGRYQKYTRADLTRLRGAGFDGPRLSLEGVSRYVDVLKAGGGLRSAWPAGREPEESVA